MKKLIFVLSLVTCLVASAFLHVYYILDGATGDLLWNGEEAYLFVSVGSLGYRMNYLQYPVEYLRAYFRTDVPSSDSKSSVFVLRLTPDGVERFETQPLSLTAINPVGNSIFAYSDEGLMKWSGAQFEHANTQELQRFETRHISGADFTNVDGWSKRCCLTNRASEVKFDIQLGGKQETLVVLQGEKNTSISISLERPGQTSEKVWFLDQRSRKVSGAEYEQHFGRH